MESIRGRLTIWYATALILSIGVFAVVLYFARRSATYQDLDHRGDFRNEDGPRRRILLDQHAARPKTLGKNAGGEVGFRLDAAIEVLVGRAAAREVQHHREDADT